MPRKSYELSAYLLYAVEILSWAALAIGLLMAFVAATARLPEIPALAWLAVSLGSLPIIAAARVGYAILDMAESCADRSFRQPSATPTSPQVAQRTLIDLDTSPIGWPIGPIKTYRGYLITGLSDRVTVNDRFFGSIEEAQAYLDTLMPKA